MRHLALFNGIGGFQLAAEWCGWRNVAHVEIDDFCNKVAARHFPESVCHTDIKEFDGTPYRGQVDIISGGFPCQPYSVAGKRLGKEDDRALWPEMRRVIEEVRPAWVVGENVAGIVSMGLENYVSDLENTGGGYDVQCFIIPACAIGAPHRRDRVWIVGRSNADDPKSRRCDVLKREYVGETKRKIDTPCNTDFIAHTESDNARGRTTGVQGSHEQQASKRQKNRISELSSTNQRYAADSSSVGREERNIAIVANGSGLGPGSVTADASDLSRELLDRPRKQRGGGGQYPNRDWSEHWVEVATRLCRVDDGVSNRSHRLKALGNAIVPQVAYEIFKAIDEVSA